ncbi:MAG: response regulator transcription factor [Bacteroidetes bacterium]|nr:response regulator transcription factor [Bacteroidota bacterium]
MGKIRVLIVDDHAILREGIRALLALYSDIEVIGEASDGLEAINETRQLSPDIVLMDIAMPGLGGLEATLEIHKQSPNSRVVILTQHDDTEYIFPILKAGAAGYILKKAVGTELVAAIRAVHQGGSFLYPSVATAVIEGYIQKGEEVEPSYDRLSDREKQVLRLIAEGHSNREIAEMLSVSVKTVIAHRANLMEKLDIHNRTELVKYAIRKGLIEVGS